MMALRIQPPPEELVSDYEIRIGKNAIKVGFGRKVPITHAIKHARSWLDGIDKDKTP